jgi:hypothetical protein
MQASPQTQGKGLSCRIKVDSLVIVAVADQGDVGRDIDASEGAELARRGGLRFNPSS